MPVLTNSQPANGLANLSVKVAAGLRASYSPAERELYDVEIVATKRRRRSSIAFVRYADVRAIEVYGDEPFSVDSSELLPPIMPDINTRFEYFGKLVDLTLDQHNNALLVIGRGGIGKTFEVESRFEMRGAEEGVHYCRVSGHTSPGGLYDVLREWKDGIILFDDCDSAFDTKQGRDILKAALDGLRKRRYISWLTKRGGNNVFEFTGSVIFLSNQARDFFDDSILSRSIMIDLTMTPEELIARMRAILPTIEKDVPYAIREQIVDFMDEHRYHISNLNLRTLVKAVNTYKKVKDFEIVRYQIFNS